MGNPNLDIIFEEWKASLKSRDRSASAVSSNFDDLFEELKKAGATFDEAHELLPRAIKAHLPPPAVARNAYKSAKTSPKVAVFTEKEFIDHWNEDIGAKGTNSFFAIFPRAKAKDADDDGEPKVFGNMSVKEYRAQRRYADQFPVLDTEELERKMLSGTYNPLDDISNILGGKKDNDGNAE